MVFFTDCDSLGQETKPNGLKGKMFVTRERDTDKVLPLLLEAARNTLNNKEEAENAVEALIEAQLRFPEAKQLVLIADNSSGVKDLHRLPEVKKPVRVVICGATLDSKQAFQSDFYEIARQTNGSLHTIEDDFKPTSVTHRSWIKIGLHYYWYNARRGKFIPSRFRERPARILGLFWL
jgi:ribonuclease HI